MAMSLDAVDPDLRAATARMQRMPALPRPVVRAVLRVMPVPRAAGVRVETVVIGGNRARGHRPERTASEAALLWVHGGGLTIGDPKQDEALCSSTAVRLGITVVAAGYRLAPTHPFPAAHDDLRAALDER